MLKIAFDNRSGYEIPDELTEKITEYIKIALESDGIEEDIPVEISYSFVTPDEIHTLNADYREQDKETDVLSFPMFDFFVNDEIELDEDMPLILGDIIVNPLQAEKQAKEYGNSFEHEVCYLSVHSVLHLLGYDHMVPEDKAVMREKEKVIMAEAEDGEIPFKSGFVSIIGRPNVGKSTLLNRIMGEKILITSPKPQTTRNAIRCIHTEKHAQMIFIDTPGMHRPKNKLGDFMQKAAMDTLEDVDAVIYMVEPESKIGPGDQYILKMLEKINTPVILAINKIDTLPKDEILPVIALYQDYDYFSAILPLSAESGDGIPELMTLLKAALPEGPMYFPEDMIVDQTERFIVSELIREKALKLLRDEVPHGIAVEILQMKTREDKPMIDIEATIFCERKSHKGMIIGKQGAMLKKIGSQARQDIAFFMKTPINLQLWVKVREDWREKHYDLKDLGYAEE